MKANRELQNDVDMMIVEDGGIFDTTAMEKLGALVRAAEGELGTIDELLVDLYEFVAVHAHRDSHLAGCDPPCQAQTLCDRITVLRRP